MKKLMALLSVVVFTPCAFAGVNTATLNRAVTTAVAQTEMQRGATVEKLVQNVKASLAQFKQSVADKQYYDANFIFQAMDNLRVDYTELHKVSAAAARGLSEQVNEPISIANGNKKIRVEAYIRMESVSLYYTEQERFEAFGRLLEQDLAAAKQVTKAAPVAIPAEFAKAVEKFRSFVKSQKEEHANFVIQSAVECMDVYNQLAGKDAKVANAMLKEFAKPIQAGWGGTLNPTAYISARLHEAIRPGTQTYYEMSDFVDAARNAK